MTGKRSRADRSAPSVARGRRGGISIADALLKALWRTPPASGQRPGDWPALTLVDLRAAVTTILGYDVPSSSVRSTVYNYPTLFERVPASKPVRYRVSAAGRTSSR